MSIKKYFLLLPMMLPIVSNADNKKNEEEIPSEDFLLFLADSSEDDGNPIDMLDMLELDNEPLVQDNSLKKQPNTQIDERKVEDSKNMQIAKQNHLTKLPKENK